MGKISGYIKVSPGLVIEIHILLLGVAIFFLIDLCNHAYRRKIGYLNTTITMVGLAPRVTFVRGMALVAFILSCILGTRLSRSFNLYKFTAYMLMSSYAMYTTFCIALSRFLFRSSYLFFSNMMLLYMWNISKITQVEELFDCCGLHGAIDYIITNRTWSQAACCELPGCDGCEQPFYEYLTTIESEIARDNIAICIATLIGMIFVIIRRMNVSLLDDPYESESSNYSEDDDEILPPKTRRKLKKSRISTTSRNVRIPFAK
ncbi:uncharacterized protein LOC111600905 [Drosophila hydei]|uniref:Uncharacterized protein LOC111600905 n=1 Tax=Drosophila hydei TaxID=7224 RepID=A0A6J1LZW9_DROHY|nr:uncharacterized protein LOC111600905 [Drosophila hydei]